MATAQIMSLTQLLKNGRLDKYQNSEEIGMSRPLYTSLLVAVVITMPIAYAETKATVGQPTLIDTQTFRVTGTIQLVNSKEGTVVIDDREYLLPNKSFSAKTAIRGMKVDFSYREAKPLPVITDISVQR